MARQVHSKKRSLSVAWEVGEVAAAVDGLRRQVLAHRDEGLDEAVSRQLEVLTGVAAGLTLVAGRLALLVRVLDGRADPLLIMAEHNEVHGPEDRLIGGICLSAWPAGVKPKGERPMMSLRQLPAQAEPR